MVDLAELQDDVHIWELCFPNTLLWIFSSYFIDWLIDTGNWTQDLLLAIQVLCHWAIFPTLKLFIWIPHKMSTPKDEYPKNLLNLHPCLTVRRHQVVRNTDWFSGMSPQPESEKARWISYWDGGDLHETTAGKLSRIWVLFILLIFYLIDWGLGVLI